MYIQALYEGKNLLAEKLQCKGRAYALFALHRYATTVQRHNLFAQAQADARTSLLGGEERHENLVLHLGQDAMSIVGDADTKQVFLLLIAGSDYNQRMGLLGASLFGILQQVNEYLLNL